MACSANPVRDREGELRRYASHSRSVALWILVSRATGFGRVAVIAAVLGPTWFGNLFQIVAVLPTIVYSLLAASALSALLVPLLVAHIDLGDAARVVRLANGALGLIEVPLLCLCVLGIAMAPDLLHALTSNAAGETTRMRQVQFGIPLLALVLPQLMLYGLVGTAVAVQQAHGRFALAAAASALENLGVIAVFAGAAALFGTDISGDANGPARLMVLGGGSTAAVALHAGLQWWGARRVGVTLLPRAGWRDPELRGMVWRSAASVGYTALYWSAFLTVIAVAARVPGGVAAFQIAHSCCQLPIALTATPLATAQLPILSRIHREKHAAEFVAVYRDGVRLVLFAALPAGLMLSTIPTTFASAAALGKMATPAGVALTAACLATLGFGVIGEAVVTLSTAAAYAGRNVIVPLVAMAARLALVAAGVTISHNALHGTDLLWGLGATLALGNLAAGLVLHLQQTRSLPFATWRPGAGYAGRLVIQLVSLLAALVVAGLLGGGRGGALHHAGVAAAAAGASMAFYIGLHRLYGSYELDLLLPILARGAARPRAARGHEC